MMGVGWRVGCAGWNLEDQSLRVSWRGGGAYGEWLHGFTGFSWSGETV